MNAGGFWTIFQNSEVIRNVCFYEFRSLALGIIYKQEQLHTLEQKQLQHIQVIQQAP